MNFKKIFERSTLDVNRDVYELNMTINVIKRNIFIAQKLLNKNTEHFPNYKDLNKHFDNMLKELNIFIRKTSY